jgi:hypothetical protein
MDQPQINLELLVGMKSHESQYLAQSDLVGPKDGGLSSAQFPRVISQLHLLLSPLINNLVRLWLLFQEFVLSEMRLARQ